MRDVNPNHFSFSYLWKSRRKWQFRFVIITIILILAVIKLFLTTQMSSSSIPISFSGENGDNIIISNRFVGRHLLEAKPVSANQSHDIHQGLSHLTSSSMTSSIQHFNCSPLALNNFPRDIFTNHQRRHGAVILHILIATYMFIGLALTCDEYFVPSLEGICNTLHLQADVAGATFMAAGSSAPELATTVIGVFIAQDDIGLGAVVGSADYNIMFVISMCALCARTVIDLNWWPLVRDSAVYCVSIIMLAMIIQDERVYWYEAASLLVVYGLYILLMYWNRPLERYFLGKFTTCVPLRQSKTTPVGVCFPHASAPTHVTHHFHEDDIDEDIEGNQSDQLLTSKNSGEDDPSEGLYEMNSFSSKQRMYPGDRKNASPYFLLPTEDIKQTNNHESTGVYDTNKNQSSSTNNHQHYKRQSNNGDGEEKESGSFQYLPDINVTTCNVLNDTLLRQHTGGDMKSESHERQADSQSCFAILEMPTRMDEEEYQRESLFANCCSSGHYHIWAVLLHSLALPLKFLLFISVPDCRLKRWKKWFWVTFFSSCLWISIFSYIMIWMISIIGYTFGIPDTVMALTFVAAGSSVPDAIASVIVVREGQGDMAVSNAVGSNVFDILVCMSLPWLLRTLISGKPVSIYSKGLLYAVLTLLSTVVILLLSTHLNRWQLTKRYGILLLIVYGAYLTLCTLYELNVFGMVHPPECPFKS